MVDADIAIAGRAGVHTVHHIEWTDCCIHIQVLVAAPDIAVLLEDTEADTCKLTAGFGERAVALPSAPESGPELLVPVDSGLRRGLGGRMADLGRSLYTRLLMEVDLELLYAFFRGLMRSTRFMRECLSSL